ncbi:MAG: ATP-binding protein [Rhodospirillaceae bacterium]
MQLSVPVIQFLITLSRLAAVAVFSAGGCVLIGWYFDITLLKSLHPQFIAMKVNTAASFLLIGAALYGIGYDQDRYGTLRWLVRSAAFIVLAMGALSLAEDVSGLDFGIDQLLIQEAPGAILTVHLGRPAPPTAVSFVLIGLALLLFDFRTRRGWYPAEAITLFQGLIAYAMLLGYVYEVPMMYTVLPNFTGMALNTSILFMVTSCGLLCCRPSRGLMAVVADVSPGGTMARILLPVSLVLPILLEIISDLTLFSPSIAWTTVWDVGSAWHSLLVSVVFFVMVLGTARALAEVDHRRRIAEAERREGEQKLTRTFDEAPIGAAIVALDGHYLRANRELERITGYSESGLQELTFVDITHQDDRAEIISAARRLIANETDHVELENRLIRSDGMAVWVQRSIRLIRDDVGTPLYFLPMITDITYRKHMEKALFEKAIKLETVLETAPVAVWIAEDPNCLNIFTNRASKAILSPPFCQQTSSFQRQVRPVIDNAATLLHRPLMQQVIDTNQPLNALELEMVSDTETSRFILGNISPLHDSQGIPWGAVAAFVDITARKQAELLADANKLLAEQASAAKSAFLATMSHELRTPLTSIIGFSEIIRDQLFGPIGTSAYIEYADDIHNSGHHLLSLINDILDVAKIEAGRMAIEPEELEIGVLLRSAIRLVSERAEKKHLNIISEVPADIGRLWADVRAVKQMLYNLLSNAIKFTPERGRITVTVGLGANGATLLAVKDNGFGIAADSLSRLTRPFEQVDNRYSKANGGTGLGLSLVRGLAELHGGHIAIESAPGVGTTVTIHFPPRQRPESVGPCVAG